MMVTDIQLKQLHACGIFQLKIWHDHSTVEGHSTPVAAKRRPADCRPAADQQFIHRSTRGQPKKRIPYNLVQTT